MSATETEKMADYPLFDWLRFGMALVVVTGHFDLLPWAHASNLAVQIFFALSGWLIGSILLDMETDRLPLFYFNRTTRVWIPYLVAVALLYGLSAARGEVGGRWAEFLTYDVTFTHNLFTLTPTFQEAVSQMPLHGTGNHFWSIAVEEQFYLFAPLLILFLPGGRHPALWIGIGIGMLFVRQEFSAIALGVAAAALGARRPGLLDGPHAPVVAAIVVLASAPWLLAEGTYPKAAPVFAIGLVLLLARKGARGRAGRFAGGISYPLYLNHWIALVGMSSIAKRLGGNGHAWAVLGTVVALGIASAAYLLVDRSILARRRRWYGPRLGWALTALSFALVGTGMVVGVRLHGNPLRAG